MSSVAVAGIRFSDVKDIQKRFPALLVGKELDGYTILGVFADDMPDGQSFSRWSYAHNETFLVLGKRRGIWIREVYVSNSVISETINQILVDCEERSIRNSRINIFFKDGTVYDEPGELVWREAVPGTVNYETIKRICSLPTELR